MSSKKHIIWWKTLSIKDRKIYLNTNSIKDTTAATDEQIKSIFEDHTNSKLVEDATTWFTNLPSSYQKQLFNTIEPVDNVTIQEVIVILYEKALLMRIWMNVIKFL